MKSIEALYKVLYRKLKPKPGSTTDIAKRVPTIAKVISLYRIEPVARQRAKVVSMFSYQ
jgi:hypothetical protein